MVLTLSSSAGLNTRDVSLKPLGGSAIDGSIGAVDIADVRCPDSGENQMLISESEKK